MQYHVPQFIDVENKIVGPLTLRQFFYLAGAAGISFLLFYPLELWLWFVITAFLAVLALALAFGKYQGRPLPQVIALAFRYIWKPKYYVWQRGGHQRMVGTSSTSYQKSNVKKLWQDLMTSKHPIAKREKSSFWGKRPRERYEVFRKLTGARDVARRVDYR